jgi:uncharacterized cupredoxin-like copper-binding protein
MQLTRLAFVPLLIVVAAGCSGGGAPTGNGGTSPAASAAPSAAATTIEVGLTDALRIEPAEMTVPAGVPVTFVVTNQGVNEHEFVLGDEAVQAEHEAEMASGGMAHDTANSISLAAGETKELTFMFEQPGETLAGCHLPGHYAGGMRAVITVSG